MINLIKLTKYSKTVYYCTASIATAIGATKGAVELKNIIQREFDKKKEKEIAKES